MPKTAKTKYSDQSDFIRIEENIFFNSAASLKSFIPSGLYFSSFVSAIRGYSEKSKINDPSKGLKPVTPAKAGVQRFLNFPGFPLSRE
jgi:hypothetical protein